MNYREWLGKSSSTNSEKESEMKLEETLQGAGIMTMSGVEDRAMEKSLRIRDLEYQVQFLTDLFATRDAQNRAIIRQYEGQIMQQSEALAYFRALGGNAMAGEGKLQ